MHPSQNNIHGSTECRPTRPSFFLRTVHAHFLQAGHWIPDPGLLLGPQNPVRLQTYLMNWLRARPVLLYMLQLPGSSETARLPAQVWRDFLYSGMPEDPKSHTKNGKRAYEIKQIFGRVFSEQQLNPACASGEAERHHRRAVAVDDHIGPLVIWETFELSFRRELRALDHAMRRTVSPAQEVERVALLARVFPSESLFAVLHLPSPESRGLFAPLPHRRISSLNALCEILRQWPMSPPDIENTKLLLISDSVDAIEARELQLACFYTQTFFDVAGRAPIVVPHRFPVRPTT
ncbi:hypothetical protein LXA43DRAFT_612968 [Ganoderma leucocontextum]|nr:hypothetical protein LXA43DRAFT_612968 [Ganoderma leucocontextum]